MPLDDAVRDFVTRQEAVFLATADAEGNADCSVRFGPPGFVKVPAAGRLLVPDYRGNGVFSSFGNVDEHPALALLFVDLAGDRRALRVAGTGRVLSRREATLSSGPRERVRFGARTRARPPAERWLAVDVAEVCEGDASDLFPAVTRRQKRIVWGTDDPGAKGGDTFDSRKTAHATPSSPGEKHQQQLWGTAERAKNFRDHQVLEGLNDRMAAFMELQERVVIAHSRGTIGCSFGMRRKGVARAVSGREVLLARLRDPEAFPPLTLGAGDGVGLLFLDFFGAGVGLHVNARVRVTEERIFRLAVMEAYMHCAKHVPLFDVYQGF